MKVSKKRDILLGIFLLLFQFCLAQRGYNYVRPGSPSAAAGLSPTVSVSNPLRQLSSTIPTGNVVSGTGFATAPATFGTSSNANVIPTTTGFGGFQGNIGTGISPNAAVSNVIGSNYAASAGSASGFASRTGVTQRPSIFGTNTARPQTTQFSSGSLGRTVNTAVTDLDYDGDGDYSAIPGIPGVDYPIYSIVPQTSFNCAQQPLPGYYSDIEAQCQVFHICALNRTYSFLCPNGTVFSQETLVCVWWNQYDCVSAPALYANNAFIYDYGNQGVPTNRGGYQESASQVGIGATRSQSGFQIASNTGRSIGTAQPSGIFGSTAGIRPISGGFGGLSTPAPATAFTGVNLANQIGGVGSRQQQSAVIPTALRQTYSDTSTGLNAAALANIAPNGLDAAGAIATGIGAQRNALQTAQLSMSSTNREYLPPARRQ